MGYWMTSSLGSSPIFCSPVWMWELDYKESWAQKNWCFWTVVLEKTLESPLDCKESQPVHPKGDQSWVFVGRTDVEGETPILWPPSCEELTHWKRPRCCERLRTGGEGDNRGWDGWMASLTQWTSVWVDSRSWWWTGRPGMLRFTGLQRVGHDWSPNWSVMRALGEKYVNSAGHIGGGVITRKTERNFKAMKILYILWWWVYVIIISPNP